MATKTPSEFKAAIEAWRGDIYAPITQGDPALWIPLRQLENLLDDGLRGLDLGGLALRTRSKVVKEAVCKALGYPVPKSFKKTQPRFPGQQFDTYVQKSTNLQMWNEAVQPSRRYVLIGVSADHVVTRVRVIDGNQLATFDTTGKVTKKYQARFEVGSSLVELVSELDQAPLRPLVTPGVSFEASTSPASAPTVGSLLPVAEIRDRLSVLIGRTFFNPGSVQERNRGAGLHLLACSALGYKKYEDSGQFPDICHQLLEVKLQTASTIDLGLVLPSSEDLLDFAPLGSHRARHCDTRYAVFCGTTTADNVTISHLVVSTGADFFGRFRRFEGKVENGKLQMHLPRDFFSL